MIGRLVWKTQRWASDRAGIVARWRRPSGQFRDGNRPPKAADFRYSVYSVKARFRRKFKNSVVPYGQDGRSGRMCSLFTKYAQRPKQILRIHLIGFSLF